MNELPEKLVLTPGPWVMIGYIAFCAVIAIAMAWVILTMGGFAPLVAALVMAVPLVCGVGVPLLAQPKMTLTRDGFSYVTRLTRKQVRWADVSPFVYKRINFVDSIWFGPVGTPEEVLNDPFETVRGGYKGLSRLMKHYGEGWEGLTELLNLYRTEAVLRSPVHKPVNEG